MWTWGYWITACLVELFVLEPPCDGLFFELVIVVELYFENWLVLTESLHSTKLPPLCILVKVYLAKEIVS